MNELFFSGDPKQTIFDFLIKLMGYRNQLRINHWQTDSYAEHKMTDKLIEALTDHIDIIGEVALGRYGRPNINTISTNVSDIAISSTSFVLDNIDKELQIIIKQYKEEEGCEGLFALLGELDATIKKYIFLKSLN